MAVVVSCMTEEDYEKFVLFFFQNRKLFAHDTYNVATAIESIHIMLTEAKILLLMENDEVIATMCYTYGTREKNFEDQSIVFIDCALLKEEYQGSTYFVQLFKQALDYIAEERKGVEEVQFQAYRHHQYVHNLYSKFAKVIGQRIDVVEPVDIFSVKFQRLIKYLERFTCEE